MTIKKSLIASLFIFLMLCTMKAYALSVEELKSFSLDQLFSQLKKETDEGQARKIENQIWLSWLKAGNDEVDGLMNDAYYFRREFNLTSAANSLNEVIAKAPNYSEAWNQRAIVFFYQGKLDLALKDIEKTLELEPRHFGAMAGRAVIHLKLNQRELAKSSIAEALDIHPFLPERTLFPELYADRKI